jgi:REP element-mobilizing transposase RayT
LYKYISGIKENNNLKVMIINGVCEHIHILIGYRPHQSLADLVQDIKACSSRWISEKKFLKSKFAWQTGYAAFSYSQSHLYR